MNKANSLRKLFESKKIIYAMGAHNGLSAKLVAKNGFDAVWASGLEISASYGLPDANILTMTEYLEKSTQMNDVIEIPVISDCDTGYGNSINVIHLVQKYEAAGIAAICIEDKVFPKVNSFFPGRQDLAPIGEFVGKILAAKNTQKAKDFMVIARVEALIAGEGEKEALLRAHKYVDAGADAILIHSQLLVPDEIISFAKKWQQRSPLVIIPTKYPSIMKDFSEDDLAALGIKMIIFANQGLRASIKAMDTVMKQLAHDRDLSLIEDKIVPIKEVFALQEMDRFQANEDKYLKTANSSINFIFLAAGKPRGQEDLEPLLRDRPVALLDIKGTSLIQKNIHTVRALGINNVFAVTGWRPEQFSSLENVGFINSANYELDFIHSFLSSEQEVKDRAIFAFADILFDRHIVAKLLEYEECDILLVGDATFKRVNMRNKALDLITADISPVLSHRSIDTDLLKKVFKIGIEISVDEASYEFIGLSSFSRKAFSVFKESYARLQSHPLPSGGEITFNHVLQQMINEGFNVSMLEVNSGWLEIHNFDNYKTACSLFK